MQDITHLSFKCLSIKHHQQRLPCTRKHHLTKPVPKHLLEEINRLRCLHDMFGGKWSQNSPDFDEEFQAEVLWEHREKTSVLTLRAAFGRMLDNERDEAEVEVMVTKGEDDD